MERRSLDASSSTINVFFFSLPTSCSPFMNLINALTFPESFLPFSVVTTTTLNENQESLSLYSIQLLKERAEPVAFDQNICAHVIPPF